MRCRLRVEGTGQVVEHAWFVGTPAGRNRFRYDCDTLGLASVEDVPLLAGKRFTGTKKQAANRSDPSRPYHNLYINARLPDAGTPSLFE